MSIIAHDPAIMRRIKRRLHALGVTGNTGGWICANEPRVNRLPDPERRPPGYSSIRLQGWTEVARWACDRANAMTSWSMVEIREGRRIGVPTIDGMSSVAEYCLALVAPGRVCLRLGDMAYHLD